ncbi:hypothetical protein LCGC14_0357740 [marine sediment metagenome]|uniref:Phage protein Gp37/Gp68 n=1 Tax=marine sediment metagenome TaxID=412755 RepID=A0A0F9TEJ1_9ZZZZ
MPTKIPYAQRNWETVGGCEKIKSGCKNCYAVNLIHRFSCNPVHKGRYEGLVKNGNWTGKIKLFDDRLEQPLRRHIPTTYFVNSRSDLFHKDVPFEFVKKMWDVTAKTPRHTYLFFTKRWRRALEFSQWMAGHDDISIAEWPRNVHLYFSASTQAEVDEAVPILLQIPVAMGGLSYEPALGPLDISEFEEEEWRCDGCGYAERHSEYRNQLGHIIVGCESGSNRRLCSVEDIKSVADQCKDAGVPCYVKQIPIDGKCVPLKEDNRAIWPAWVVQEMPNEV